MQTFAAVLIACLLFTTPARAVRQSKKRRASKPPAVLTVQPSEVIEQRVEAESYAVDLFTNEGPPVPSAARGVVVIADKHWAPGEPFSTTSQKGGNSVIVFDRDGDRFLRYAHLDQVFVAAGGTVRAGEQIGSVGHTGLNASRPKHGRHLHFEVNECHEGKTRAFRNAGLWSLDPRRRTHARQCPGDRTRADAASCTCTEFVESNRGTAVLHVRSSLTHVGWRQHLRHSQIYG